MHECLRIFWGINEIKDRVNLHGTSSGIINFMFIINVSKIKHIVIREESLLAGRL